MLTEPAGRDNGYVALFKKTYRKIRQKPQFSWADEKPFVTLASNFCKIAPVDLKPSLI